MNKNFIRDEKFIDNDPIVVAITEEMIQAFAEANFDRKLTNPELNRFAYAIWENDNANSEIHSAIWSATEDVLNDKNDWSEYDKDFLEDKG